MSKVSTVLAVIGFLIVGKIVGTVIGHYMQGGDKKEAPLSSDNGLRSFLSEFVVNSEHVKYPVMVSEGVYLTGRSISEQGRQMYVSENYKFTLINSSSEEIALIEESARTQILGNFCASLPKRENLYKGYSSVGVINNMYDSGGKLLFSVKVDKAMCGK